MKLEMYTEILSFVLHNSLTSELLRRFEFDSSSQKFSDYPELFIELYCEIVKLHMFQ